MKFIITATPDKVTKTLEFNKNHKFLQTANKDEHGCWTISPAFREFVTEANGCYVDPDELSVLDEMIYMDSYDEEMNDASTIARTLSKLGKYSSFED